MTNYEKITKNKESLIDFLDQYGDFDGSPWQNWFNEKYCSHCESEKVYISAFHREAECAWCELKGKCKYFQEKEDTPSNKEMIAMWLEEQV